MQLIFYIVKCRREKLKFIECRCIVDKGQKVIQVKMMNKYQIILQFDSLMRIPLLGSHGNEYITPGFTF